VWLFLSGCLSLSVVFFIVCFFFFQAEDGIRDFHVTGVQTCALPIFSSLHDEGFFLSRLVERPGRGGAPLWQGEVRAVETEYRPQDRKSTRLNSSHVKISYAVFCLKKKSQGTRRGDGAAPFTDAQTGE